MAAREPLDVSQEKLETLIKYMMGASTSTGGARQPGRQPTMTVSLDRQGVRLSTGLAAFRSSTHTCNLLVRLTLDISPSHSQVLAS